MSSWVLFSEFLAFTAVIVACIPAFRSVDGLCVATAGAVLLTSHLAHWLGCRTYLVDHTILSLVTTNLSPNYDHFFLRYPNRLVALRTQIATHLKPLEELKQRRS